MIAGYRGAAAIVPVVCGPDGARALPLPPATARGILGAVAARFGVTVEQLQGPARARALVQARNAASFLLRARPVPGGKQRSYPEMAAALGGRDHSTIIHAVEQAIRQAGRDADYAGAVEELARDPALAHWDGSGALVLPVRVTDAVADAAELLADLPRGEFMSDKAKAALARKVSRKRVEAVLAKRVCHPRNELDDDDTDARMRLTGSAGLLDAILRARAESAAA